MIRQPRLPADLATVTATPQDGYWIATAEDGTTTVPHADATKG